MLKPQASRTRESVNLDGIWRFALEGDDQPWLGTLRSQLDVAVPASYNDQFTSTHIRDHVGWAWYQRTVNVPRGWETGRTVLRFDAVTHAAEVYVDDTHVGGHVGGYLPFEIDVTDAVTSGQPFRLTVGVDNELTEQTIPPGKTTVRGDGRRKQVYHHDFFNYAGIARSVALLHVPDVAVEDVTVVTRFEGTTGFVDYAVSLSGEGDVRLTLEDEDGATVSEGAGLDGSLTVDDVTLWQPGKAYLYTLRIVVEKDGELLDEYSLRVGVRTVEVRGRELLINGEPFYFTGFGKHEDSPVRGKGHDDAYLIRDFELMKWMGANSFRTSHYPYAEEVLDHADRHGFVVIDETAAVGLNLGVSGGMTARNPPPTFSPETLGDSHQATLAQHLRDLIQRDKNHPSVVMWCIANEPASQEDGAYEYFAPLAALARELDPTRPITYTAWLMANAENDQIAELFDVIGINRYFGWYIDLDDFDSAEKRLREDIAGWLDKFDRPIMMTEYGADTISGLHSVEASPWSEEYQSAFLDMHHRVFDDFPGFVGEHVWNFADFQTTSGLARVGGNKKGVFTRDRTPKTSAHTLRKRWLAVGTTKPESGAGTDPA